MKKIKLIFIILFLLPIHSNTKGDESILSAVSWVRFLSMDWNVEYGKMVLNGDNLYVQKFSLLTCINPESGETIWAIKCNYKSDTSPVVSGNLLIAACNDRIIGYNKTTGKVEWERQCKTHSGLSNVINGNAYLLADNNLCFVNCENGKIIKLTEIKTEKYIPDLIQTQNEVILFHKYLGRIQIFEKSDYRAILDYTSKDSIYMKRIIHENTLFVGYRYQMKGQLVSIDIGTGRINWTSIELRDVSDMEYHNGMIYTYKYCIDSTEGTVVWENYDLNKYVNRIFWINDKMYYVNGDGSYDIVDPKNGDKLFSDNRIHNSSFCTRRINDIIVYKSNIICITNYFAMYMFSPVSKKITIDLSSNYSTLDDSRIIWNDDKPFISKGTTYVSPTEIIEPLGGITNCLLFKEFNACVLNGKKYAFVRDNSYATDGSLIPGCIVKNKVTYIPLRKTAEMLGLKITWDAKTKTATISR